MSAITRASQNCCLKLFPVPKGLRLNILFVAARVISFEIVPCTEGIKTSSQVNLPFNICLKLFPVPKGLRLGSRCISSRGIGFEIVPCTEGIKTKISVTSSPSAIV